MKQILRISTAFCFALTFGSPAVAADTNAIVAAVQAPAWVERDGARQPLQAGAALSSGDRLSTGKDARVVLSMPDDSTVKLGERVQFEIRELQPAQADQPFRGFLRVLAGAFRYTTSPSGKIKSRQLNIQVGTATIGIRGTDVWGKSEPDQDLVCLLEGKIEITRQGEMAVPMWEARSVYTAAPKKPTDPLSKVDIATVQILALETELSQGQGVIQPDGKYAVYLFSERRAGKAERRKKRLQKDGYAAQVYTVEVDGRTLYRVAIPHFASAEDAKSAAVKLEKLYRRADIEVGEL